MKPLRLDVVPQSLRNLNNWVLWKTATRHGKPTKVPFQCSGDEAKSNTPETWTDFLSAFSQFNSGGYEGVGFVFSKDQDFIGIDLDGCRNPETGEWAQWAREIISQFQSYTEMSPSQTGAKIFIRGRNPLDGGKKIKLPDAPKMCDKEPAIEIYSFGRYFATTGWIVRGCPRETEYRQEEIEALVEKYIPDTQEPQERRHRHPFLHQSVEKRAAAYIAKIPPAVDGYGGSDVCFHVACVLVRDYDIKPDQAFPILNDWSMTCTPPWSEKELWHKLRSADEKAKGPRGRLLDTVPEQWNRIRIPIEKEPPRQPEIKVCTLQDASYRYLDRVESGSEQLFDLGLPDLDYAIGGGVERQEMIVFVGRPSHGKSLCAQQCIYSFIRNNIPSLFISEEMSDLLLGKRSILTASDISKEHWQYRAGAVRGHLDEFWKDTAPCYIVENCRTADRIVKEIERHVSQKGVGFVVVDYAQKITAGNPRRFDDVTQVAIALKNVIKDQNIPGVVLAQMGRAIEHRPQFVPVMSDIRETGQIEAEADVIVAPVWPHALDSNKPHDEYMMYVLKNRSREINQRVVQCKFLPSRQMLVTSRETDHAPIDAAVEFPTSRHFGIGNDPRL